MSTVIQTKITEEMKKSYLDYAMSVIVSRALPDVRDGLKPVQRRILYTMYRLGLTYGAKYKKSATVVGEVLGKYHPHGDTPVYDALVRMAQEFSMRYPLIKGQGNFGSIDGDPPAAMRYTEVKLERIAEQILSDWEKETVGWRDNFDNSLKEPEYLPGKVPNLLLNGAEGIAVGMATKIPPHNLGEIIDALLYTVEKAKFDIKLSLNRAIESVSFETSIDELLSFVKGPDFPTGGILYSKNDIKEAYQTGRKSLVVRGAAVIQEIKNGRDAIIISELPYQVNKSTLIKKIADLVSEKKIKGIRTIRDESDRRGIRIVIELKRDAVGKKVLNNLYSKSQLQTTFPVNMVALVNGIPQTLSLKSILDHFLKHRADVVARRTRFLLKGAKARAHILEGLVIAIDNIDEVVEIIKSSKTEAEAKTRLINRFSLSPLQAQAILDMQLKRLTALEKEKLEAELAKIKHEIARLEEILSSLKNVFKVVVEEFAELKKTFSDKRKTKIIASRPGEFSDEELIENRDVYVMITKDGYIKSLSQELFKSQKRGGKGVSTMGSSYNGDSVSQVLSCKTHDTILFFTTKGKVYQTRCWEIPETNRRAKGKSIVNLINVEGNEKVTRMYAFDPTDPNSLKDGYVFFATKGGYVKKTHLKEYKNIRTNGLIAISLQNNDELLAAEIIKPESYIFLVSVTGKAILFKEKDVRSMGRGARGVRGMKLKGQDKYLTTLGVVHPQTFKKSFMIIVTKKGYGKVVSAKEFKTQTRGGVGVKAANITKKSGPIVFCRILLNPQKYNLLLTSSKGQVVQIEIMQISRLSRNAQGVIIMRFSEKDDYIATATIVSKEA